jgi:hypothetical protein
VKPLIDAIKALLAPLGYPVYYVDAPDRPTMPYVLLWGSSGVPSSEQAIVGPGDLTDLLGITTVAATPEAVLIVRSRVRTVLDDSRPTSAGSLVWLNLADSRPTAVDRDVTDPTTNRHPAYGVDMYRLIAVPA